MTVETATTLGLIFTLVENLLVPVVITIVVLFYLIVPTRKATKSIKTEEMAREERRREYLGLDAKSDAQTSLNQKATKATISEAYGKNQPKNRTKTISELKDSLEDRNGDWLASQLRYEHVNARRNKLDLGAAHDMNCNAEEVRLSHAKECEDKRVDPGTIGR